LLYSKTSHTKRLLCIINVQGIFSFFPVIFFRSETERLLLRIIIWRFRTAELLLDMSNTEEEYSFIERHKSGKPHHNRPLKFVCTRNLTSADRLTFSRPIRNAVSYICFLGAVSKISRIYKIVGAFVHCLLPSPSPPLFLVSTSVQLSCGCNLYFANHKRKKQNKTKTHQKPPATQPTNNNINQNLKENKTN